MNIGCKYYIDFKKWGSQHIVAADLDGDGLMELLVYQGPGQFRGKEGERYIKSDPDLRQENMNLQCITAVRLDGTVLWQAGEPWRYDTPYRSHMGARITACADFLDAGAKQVLCLDHGMLTLRDALNGSVIKTCPPLPPQKGWPNNPFWLPPNKGLELDHLTLFYPAGPRNPCVLIKPVGAGWGRYSNPNMFLNSNLEELWPRRDVHGSGHQVSIKDIDGDGFDEILNGYELQDHDGRVLWGLPLPDHADCEYFADINGDGKDEIILLGGLEEVLCLDLAGRTLWSVTDLKHVQHACSGAFISEIPGRQTVFVERDLPVMLAVDARGRKIWQREIHGYGLPVNWPTSVGRESMVVIRLKSSDPNQPAAEYKPAWIDGGGNLLMTFDLPDLDLSYLPKIPGKDKNHPVSFGDAADYGMLYYCYVADVDNDGRDEVLVASRVGCWIFGLQ